MKKITRFLLVSVLTVYLGLPVPAAEAYASLTAPSAILFEPGTQKILYQRAPHRKQAPASTAKLVTALVVLDSLDLNQWVVISPAAEDAEPSKLYLKAGERLRVRDLLKAVLMKSANDAAAALAIEVSGSERAFADLMTQRARKLGAENTRFINASGLPAEGQYSTAYDLAFITQEAMKRDVIKSILRAKSASIQTASGKRFYLKSHNKMLLRGEKVIGKTGWTRNAKYCFAGLIEGGQRQVIVSVLGSRKLWVDLKTLVQRVTGFGKSSVLKYGSRGEAVKELQSALKRAGFFNARATGYFGKITKKAVIQFQRAKGLQADGMAGAQTQKALFS